MSFNKFIVKFSKLISDVLSLSVECPQVAWKIIFSKVIALKVMKKCWKMSVAFVFPQRELFWNLTILTERFTFNTIKFYFRWKKVIINENEEEWYGVFSNLVWILKQHDDHILYQVYDSMNKDCNINFNIVLRIWWLFMIYDYF